MEYRPLGKTGLEVSRIAFGCGPVPALLTSDLQKTQVEVVRRALDAGVNWFDTAAGYGAGASELHLGAALTALGGPDHVHIATKIRLAVPDLADIKSSVKASVRASLDRLQRDRVTLIQLHNGITARRDDEPTSIAPADVLGSGGVLEAFDELRTEGLVDHFGLTGLGHSPALRDVLATSAFVTVQAPFHLLNPTAARKLDLQGRDVDYDRLFAACIERDVAVFAIRVFAGGALLDLPPSPHTHRTKFFPLELYQRDRRRARSLAEAFPDVPLAELALRYAFTEPTVTSTIIGFSAPEHVDQAITALDRGPLTDELRDRLERHVAIGENHDE